jgi:hypothetical protein
MTLATLWILEGKHPNMVLEAGAQVGLTRQLPLNLIVRFLCVSITILGKQSFKIYIYIYI